MSLGSLLGDGFGCTDFPLMHRLQFEDATYLNNYPQFVSVLDEFYEVAPKLRHLSVIELDDSLTHYLWECQQLLSLTCDIWNVPEPGQRFSFPPLIAIRVGGSLPHHDYQFSYSDDETELPWDPIDSSKPSFFFADVRERDFHTGNGDFVKWVKSKGLRLEYADGELEQGWAEGNGARRKSFRDSQTG